MAKDAPKEAPASADNPLAGAPESMPIDIETWKARKAPAYGVLVAGFEHQLRLTGGLLAKQTTEEWEKKFAAFSESPRDNDPAKKVAKK